MGLPNIRHVIGKIRIIKIGLNKYIGSINMRAQNEFFVWDIKWETIKRLKVTSPPVRNCA